jgi:lipoprotein NlpI
MSESDLDERFEYDALREFARALGFHAQVHQGFDRLRAAPGREDACWYLQRSKKFSGRLEHEPSILKFALASEVYSWLVEYRAQTQETRGCGISNQKPKEKRA